MPAVGMSERAEWVVEQPRVDGRKGRILNNKRRSQPGK